MTLLALRRKARQSLNRRLEPRRYRRQRANSGRSEFKYARPPRSYFVLTKGRQIFRRVSNGKRDGSYCKGNGSNRRGGETIRREPATPMRTSDIQSLPLLAGARFPNQEREHNRSLLEANLHVLSRYRRRGNGERDPKRCSSRMFIPLSSIVQV
jgi:hypothetical protein